MIQKSTLLFLSDLAKNNNRDWFNSHKNDYLIAKENAELFVDNLIQIMGQHDQLETTSAKKSLYRIHKDVRFSADKTPYNPRFAGHLKRMKPFLRGGYYFWIRPGDSRAGCGFTYPNPEDLKRIRTDIDHHSEDWKKHLGQATIKNTFGNMKGEKVNTSPKGFSKDHPAIGLLRFKQYWFERSFSDKEVLASDFIGKLDKTFQSIRPFFDYMSEVLTTDANGVPIRY